jgi:hypothetical protein
MICVHTRLKQSPTSNTMTDTAYLQQLRTPTPENPLRILMSACLSGIACSYDSTAKG